MGHLEITFHCVITFFLMFVNQVKWRTSVYDRVADMLERYQGVVKKEEKDDGNVVVEISHKSLERFTNESIYFSAMHMLFTPIVGLLWVWSIYMIGAKAYHDGLTWMVLASILLAVYILVLIYKICSMCYSYCDTVDLMMKPTLRGESNHGRTYENCFNFNVIMDKLYDREEGNGKLLKFGFVIITIYLTFFIGTVRYYW